MASPEISPSSPWRDVVAWVLHLALYSLFLAAYFLFVVRHFSGWFVEMFHRHRFEYAAAAIAVMIIQAVVLESLSAFILRCFHFNRK